MCSYIIIRKLQLREEYEKQAKRKREQELENLVRSRSEYQLTLDATQVFDPYEPPAFAGFGGNTVVKPRKRRMPWDRIVKAQVQQLFMRHSFQVHFTKISSIGSLILYRHNLDHKHMQYLEVQCYRDQVWAEVI